MIGFVHFLIKHHSNKKIALTNVLPLNVAGKSIYTLVMPSHQISMPFVSLAKIMKNVYITSVTHKVPMICEFLYKSI